MSWIFDFTAKFVIAWLYWFCIEKYWWVTFHKDLFFAKNNVFCLWLSGALSKVGFTIFPWKFSQVLYAATFKNLCVDLSVLFFFCFLRSTNSEKILLRFFVGISKKNPKFQRKTTNSAALEIRKLELRNFDLFRRKT